MKINKKSCRTLLLESLYLKQAGYRTHEKGFTKPVPVQVVRTRAGHTRRPEPRARLA